MRALFITPVVPAATGNGLSMRAGMWLEALAARFDTDVAVAAMFAPHANAEAFTGTLAASTTMLRGRLLHTPGTPRHVPTLDDTSAAALRELTARADIVVVFRLYLAALADDAHARGIPVVLDLDDLDWVREERLDAGSEASAYRAYADAMLARVAVATTAAAADAGVGADIYRDTTWMHVPNGIRTPTDPAGGGTATTHPESQDIDLLFVGSLSYVPNVDAATWLVHEVLPRLPGVTAAVVGAIPAPEVRALASARVQVAADVADVTPWYRRARICVVPIHSGSGTRMKIAEAWAHRRPVVTTTVGAEGIDVDGAALVADDAGTFAAACATLLAEPKRAKMLAGAGYERFVGQHTWTHAIAHADAVIDVALKAAGRTPPPHKVRP